MMREVDDDDEAFVETDASCSQDIFENFELIRFAISPILRLTKVEHLRNSPMAEKWTSAIDKWDKTRTHTT
jgi:hypothetical protein